MRPDRTASAADRRRSLLWKRTRYYGRLLFLALLLSVPFAVLTPLLAEMRCGSALPRPVARNAVAPYERPARSHRLSTGEWEPTKGVSRMPPLDALITHPHPSPHPLPTPSTNPTHSFSLLSPWNPPLPGAWVRSNCTLLSSDMEADWVHFGGALVHAGPTTYTLVERRIVPPPAVSACRCIALLLGRPV